MEIWEGLFLGLLGSFHCLGMCGPLALAIPHSSESKIGVAMEDLLYNLGRVFTYSLLGLIAGSIGASIRLAGMQEIVSIILGVILLIVLVLPSKWKNLLTDSVLTQKSFALLKKQFNRFFAIKSKSKYFGIGFMNGLLPCGLVYVAMTAAIAGSTIWDSVLFMAAFGFGTVPMMFAIFFAKKFLTLKLRSKISKLIPVGVFIVAILLILRGMSLGIPYISPVLPDKVYEKSECCH